MLTNDRSINYIILLDYLYIFLSRHRCFYYSILILNSETYARNIIPSRSVFMRYTQLKTNLTTHTARALHPNRAVETVRQRRETVTWWIDRERRERARAGEGESAEWSKVGRGREREKERVAFRAHIFRFLLPEKTDGRAMAERRPVKAGALLILFLTRAYPGPATSRLPSPP